MGEGTLGDGSGSLEDFDDPDPDVVGLAVLLRSEAECKRVEAVALTLSLSRWERGLWATARVHSRTSMIPTPMLSGLPYFSDLRQSANGLRQSPSPCPSPDGRGDSGRRLGFTRGLR